MSDDTPKVCIGCDQPQGMPHAPGCLAVGTWSPQAAQDGEAETLNVVKELDDDVRQLPDVPLPDALKEDER